MLPSNKYTDENKRILSKNMKNNWLRIENNPLLVYETLLCQIDQLQIISTMYIWDVQFSRRKDYCMTLVVQKSTLKS